LKFAKLQRTFPDSSLDDPTAELQDQLDGFLPANDIMGKRIAVAVGSRGIDHLPDLVATLVKSLKDHGADPFIVPAMGSHGGATGEGQENILAALGIDEPTIGAPVHSSMETVCLGEVEAENIKWPVYIDKNAHDADTIIPINRIKAHTDFCAAAESGILKMLAIGLGKEKGARIAHSHGTLGMKVSVTSMARLILDSLDVLGGVALVENGYHHLAHVEMVPADRLMQREPELLEKAKSWMADIPTDQLDSLVVTRMGKEISGTGMDTNVIGRKDITDSVDVPNINITYVGVCSLTDQTGGNAIGIGAADMTTAALVEKIDRRVTLCNVIAAGFPGRGKIPIILETEKEMLETMIDFSRRCGNDIPRIMIIRDTLNLDTLYATASLAEELQQRDDVHILHALRELHFDEDGRLKIEW
jgi:hypothetical protein